MKKVLILIAILTSGILVEAQIYSYGNGKLTNVNEQDNNYIEVKAGFTINGAKLKYFYVDYGQVDIVSNPGKIMDKNAKEIILKSTGAMLNHFDKNGWLLVNIYFLGNTNQAAMIYIFIKKNIKKDKDE